MFRAWPQVRYWCALSVSLCLAVLTVPGGLAMGGPTGLTGWAAVGVLLVAPVAIWWTRHWANAGAFVQYAYLLPSALALGYFILMVTHST